jgi:UDP-N-acetylmuramate dehydrogenase
MSDDFVRELEEATGLPVRRGESLARHTSLGIGGPADLFRVAPTVEALIAAVRAARAAGVPVLLIGNGSNLLVRDGGVRGLVIKNRADAIRLIPLDAEGRELPPERAGDAVSSLWQVDAGVLFPTLARATVDAGWTGLEWGQSVPGTVGGGVVSNAGAHGSDLRAVLTRIWVLTAEGAVEAWPAERLALGYRTSIFKAHGALAQRSLAPGPVILRAELRLLPGGPAPGRGGVVGDPGARGGTPPPRRSAGSTFKNPLPHYAGQLLEAAGMKGARAGRAQFSPKHANFMMNLGGARASEVMQLIDQARTRVREMSGVALETELEIVGEET